MSTDEPREIDCHLCEDAQCSGLVLLPASDSRTLDWCSGHNAIWFQLMHGSDLAEFQEITSHLCLIHWLPVAAPMVPSRSMEIALVALLCQRACCGSCFLTLWTTSNHKYPNYSQ